MSDTLEIFGLKYSNIDGIKVIDENGNELTYSRYPTPISGEADPNPVKFYDYDGALLYSYSVADFLALDALPANPTHTGLTSQGWNWSLANAKSYVNAYGALDVGQEYTESALFISVCQGCENLYLGLAVNGTISIDWGDGTSSTVTGTSYTTRKNTSHTYATTGDYRIKITVTSGGFTFYGGSNSSSPVINGGGSSLAVNQPYSTMVNAVIIGRNCSSSIGAYGLCYCQNVRALILPRTVTSIGNQSFSYATSATVLSLPEALTSVNSSSFSMLRRVKRVLLPPSLTYVYNSAFSTCNAETLIIPYGVETISDSSFSSWFNLRKVVLPSSVTSVAASAFRYCYACTEFELSPSMTTVISTSMQGMPISRLDVPASITDLGLNSACDTLRELVVRATVPPTVSGIPSGIRLIRVPAGSLTAYQNATNWSAHASKMVEM